jgi:hypothetical protein
MNIPNHENVMKALELLTKEVNSHEEVKASLEIMRNRVHELEQEVEKLKRQRAYLINEITSGDDDGNAYCPLPAGWNCIHQSASGWGCNSCRDDRKACWIKAMEVYEV